jgi:putative aldouronate transport system permease protein
VSRHGNGRRPAWGEIAFDGFNLVALSAVGLLALFPFLYILALSFSTPQDVMAGELLLLPRKPSLTAYKVVLAEPNIRMGLMNSVFRTIAGTALTLIATALAAYPLSRPQMPGRRKFAFFILFTMIFSGGLVPTYLLIKGLGLIDNRMVYIIPGMITAFNVLVLKNFFQQIPESLEEAARIDGAGDFRILFRIFIPLSAPALATIALWTAVAHWNAWFDGMIYINSDAKRVLQVFLRQIVIENMANDMAHGIPHVDRSQFSAEAVKAAVVVVTVLPILALYPFLQRYFIKGITLGGTKE